MTRRSTAAGVAIVMLVLLLAACRAHGKLEPGAEGFALIVTQVPVGTDVERLRDPFDPEARFPAGSRVVLARPGDGPDDVVVLSGELWAAGGPAVSPDGSTVLFAGRKEPQSNWAIYEVSVRGSRPRPRPIADTGNDCIDPAFLPGEGVVFTCSDGKQWQLYTASRARDDRPGRITFGAGGSNSPSVLRDGRILFTMSQEPGAGRPDPEMTALFTVNPDGTLPGAFAGSHAGPALKFRARQTSTDDVIYIAAGSDEERRIESVPMSRPAAVPSVMDLEWSDGVGSVPTRLEATSVEPLPDGSLLAAARPRTAVASGESTWGVFLAPPGSETATPVFDDLSRHEIEAIPVAAGIEPRGRPVVVRSGARTGTLVCYDSNRSDGVIGPAASDPPPTSMTIETRDGAESLEVPLEEDGSFLVEALADAPLRIVSRDADGRAIATSGWFWIRPGEVRACFGCHESRESAPVNRIVQALDVGQEP